MNNKKLFKGALVLFASILMAVSCSSGDKTGSTGNDNTNKDDTTTQKKDFPKITLAPTANEISKGVVIKGVEQTVGASKEADVVASFAQEDGKDFDTTGVKYKVTGVTRETGKIGTDPTVTASKDATLSGKTDAFTYDGKKITIVASTKLVAGWTSGDKDGYKVDIEVSKDGYKPTTISIYVGLQQDS